MKLSKLFNLSFSVEDLLEVSIYYFLTALPALPSNLTKVTIAAITGSDREKKKTPIVSHMAKLLQKEDKFKLYSQRSLQKFKAELTRWQLAQLRGKLDRGIYWFQLEPGGVIHWNWTLLQSYMVQGEHSIEHQALVAEYMDTIPKSA